ncbi:MAG: CatA-like O-acetyltransferase [Ignavibacteria bacterium]|jgi:chloramphenicol O-acetyltransferase type A
MHYINPKNWKRKKHFEFFRKFKFPHFNICTEIEITETYHYTRRNKTSIFSGVLFAVMKTCNHFEEFRYRIKGQRIKVYDIVHPGTTVLADNDLYSNCIFNFTEPFEKFLNEYKIASAKIKKIINVGEGQKGRDDLIFISALPWITFTSVTNPMNGNPDDSIPRIIWGKHFRRNKKIFIPFSVQVHHALMDGVHVAKFFFKLTDLLKEPEKLFSNTFND